MSETFQNATTYTGQESQTSPGTITYVNRNTVNPRIDVSPTFKDIGNVDIGVISSVDGLGLEASPPAQEPEPSPESASTPEPAPLTPEALSTPEQTEIGQLRDEIRQLKETVVSLTQLVESRAATPAEKSQDLINQELYEKWKNSNIDPKIVVKLKENLAKKAGTMGSVDASTMKVLSIYEITGQLLADGEPVQENGDFTPEGMHKLYEMSDMMDLPDEVLSKLAADRQTDVPDAPVETAGNVPVTPVENSIDINAGGSAEEDKNTKEDKNKLKSFLRKRLDRFKEIVKSKDYSQMAKMSAVYTYRAAKFGLKMSNKAAEKAIDYIMSGELAKQRRAALGWMAGALATAGAAYEGIDRKLFEQALVEQDTQAAHEQDILLPPVENYGWQKRT